MPTDAELLHRYVEQPDERAFAELVQRHLGLVYAAAVRRTCGRSHLAEEISQEVFGDLARKAAALRRHPALTGWLYYATISTQRDGFFSFWDQFSSVRKATFDDKGLSLQRILFPDRPDRWLPLSETLYRRELDPKPGLAIVRGERSKPWIQYDYGTLAQISQTGFWLQVGGFVFSLVMMLSVVLFAPVWGLRKALGRLPASYPVSLCCFPLLGALSFFGFIALYAAAGSGGYAVLGTVNALTIGVMLVSFGIPLGALLSGIAVWRHRNAPLNRVAYWHSVLVTLSLVFITGMSLHWGVIGLRLWA